jgi:hypothetical protein
VSTYSVEKLLGYLVEEFSGGLRRATEWRSSILSRSERSKFWDADPEHLPFEFFNRIDPLRSLGIFQTGRSANEN